MKFEKSFNTIDYIAFGILINKNIALYDTNKRTIISFLFYKWVLNITVIKSLLTKD